jgi:ribonuclease P protein component
MTTPLQPAPRQIPRQSLAGARLAKHADYQRAYAASRKRQSASMSWFLAPHPNEQKSLAGDPGAPQSPAGTVVHAPAGPRVGLTAGKVLGKAHERNRIKRRMKEVLRRHLELLPPGCDLILHPRRTVLTMDFKKLEAEMVRILQQAKTEAVQMKQNSVPLVTPKTP